MSKVLPYSMQDVHYDNDKFRPRNYVQTFATKNISCNYLKCSTGKLLLLLMACGIIYLISMHQSPSRPTSTETLDGVTFKSLQNQTNQNRNNRIGRLWQKPPRLPPQLPPENLVKNILLLKSNNSDSARIWASRQESVKNAFIHAWSGYKKYAMGYDELMPLSKRGVDGLGGLGATIVDSLDTALIMGLNNISSEARYWIENNLPKRITEKGQVNLFETTIRVLGGLLSAYNLSEKPEILLKIAKDLADRLLSSFTSSPTAIPFSDVVLHENSAHAAPDGLSSTAEVTTLQLEFGYLSQISGNQTYNLEAMKVFEHIKKLPKVEGLVPIYINPYTGEFSGENIRLGSRGDSYYEYLIKVWLQQDGAHNGQLKYLHQMYEEAMKGVRNLLVRKSTPKGLVFVGELPYGHSGTFSPKMDHLVCFLPGTLALGATKGLTKKKAMEEKLMKEDDLTNLELAEELAKTCFEIYAVTSTGLASEIVYFNIGESEENHGGGNHSSEYINDVIIKPADRHNLLRPETVESLFVLYRITEDPKYREWGWRIFEAFERHTKVASGGYSSLDDVTAVPPPPRDKMETFFLGETLKYLYLLFGDPNVLPLDKFVFNTEAHPLPIHRN